MNDFGEPPEDREGEEGTTFNQPDDDREAETNNLEWDTSFDYVDDVREDLDEMREADRDLGRGIGEKRKKITNIKKSILFELDYKLRKGDGPRSTELFDRLELTRSEKSRDVIGMKFDNVRIIISGGSKKFTFSENKKFTLKINEFENLAKEAKEEHDQTAVGFLEETISTDIFVDDEHTESILSNSSERLNEEISDRKDRIVPLLTEQEAREFAGDLNPKGDTVKTKLDFF